MRETHFIPCISIIKELPQIMHSRLSNVYLVVLFHFALCRHCVLFKRR